MSIRFGPCKLMQHSHKVDPRFKGIHYIFERFKFVHIRSVPKICDLRNLHCCTFISHLFSDSNSMGLTVRQTN